MALGAMKAILEAGLRIPEDIAVIGCGLRGAGAPSNGWSRKYDSRSRMPAKPAPVVEE